MINILSIAEVKHNIITRQLEERLKTLYPYVRRHEQYEHGEYDVHCITRKGYHHYYEVKSRDTDAGFARALQQFKRHAQYNIGEPWKYIYVTPERVVRVRNIEQVQS